MPRRPRNYLPGQPYHIVQRGNNREPCFRARTDFMAYLELWRAKSAWYGVDVHAFCLMPNHIHFIVTSAEADGISNTMKTVGSRYAAYFNRRYQRTGTLWEGRHRSSLIDSDNYLLTCYRYVELNPVRAAIVTLPGDYEWSSFHFNTDARPSWLEPHRVFTALGRDPATRVEHYLTLIAEPLSAAERELIRTAAYYSQPVGDDAFRERLATRFGLKPGYLKRGRPPNSH